MTKEKEREIRIELIEKFKGTTPHWFNVTCLIFVEVLTLGYLFLDQIDSDRFK